MKLKVKLKRNNKVVKYYIFNNVINFEFAGRDLIIKSHNKWFIKHFIMCHYIAVPVTCDVEIRVIRGVKTWEINE